MHSREENARVFCVLRVAKDNCCWGVVMEKNVLGVGVLDKVT